MASPHLDSFHVGGALQSASCTARRFRLPLLFALLGITGVAKSYTYVSPPLHPSSKDECYAWGDKVRPEIAKKSDEDLSRCSRLYDTIRATQEFRACSDKVLKWQEREYARYHEDLKSCLDDVKAQKEERGRSPGAASALSPKAARNVLAANLLMMIAQKMFRANVESTLGRGASSDESKKAAENTELSKKAFDKLRDRLKFNRLVKRIEDDSFKLLQTEVDTAFQQLNTLDKDIREITKAIPSEAAVRSRPLHSLPHAIPFRKTTLDYEGEVNARGLPEGWGIAVGRINDSFPVKYIGSFHEGKMIGPGELQVTWGSGKSWTWRGQVDDGVPSGPGERTYVSGSARPEVVQVGSGGVANVSRPDGSVFKGRTRYMRPAGVGELTTPDAVTVGTFADGGTGPMIKRFSTSKSELRCKTALNGVCNGEFVGRYESGALSAGTALNNIAVGPQLDLEKSATGSWVIIEGNAKEGYLQGAGRVSFEEGDVYEGQLVDGLWGIKGAIGRYRYADGTVVEGKWSDHTIEDGIVTFPSGRKERIGAGSTYVIETFVSEAETLGQRPSGPEGSQAGKPGNIAVRAGDSLLLISLDTGVDAHDIWRWNGIKNPNLLDLGQVLRLTPPE